MLPPPLQRRAGSAGRRICWTLAASSVCIGLRRLLRCTAAGQLLPVHAWRSGPRRTFRGQDCWKAAPSAPVQRLAEPVRWPFAAGGRVARARCRCCCVDRHHRGYAPHAFTSPPPTFTRGSRRCIGMTLSPGQSSSRMAERGFTSAQLAGGEPAREDTPSQLWPPRQGVCSRRRRGRGLRRWNSGDGTPTRADGPPAGTIAAIG